MVEDEDPLWHVVEVRIERREVLGALHVQISDRLRIIDCGGSNLHRTTLRRDSVFPSVLASATPW